MDKEDAVYIYNGILLGHKKEWNLAICNHTDGAREFNAKWNKSEKGKYHMISLTCGIEETKQMSKEKKETQTKKQTLNYREQTNGYQRGGGWGDGD